MFVSSPSPSPGPSSSVQKWLLSVVTLLAMMASSLAASAPPDLCLEDPTKFALEMHTIGSVDSRLWAIIKDNWTVYELVPCKQNVPHCMVVSSPVAIETKWPKLAETVKSAAGVKDFNFTVKNSVVMNSSAFGHTVLAMGGSFVTESNYFGFDFGVKNSVKADVSSNDINRPGSWISSDVKDKAYRLLDSGMKIDQIGIEKSQHLKDSLSIYVVDNSNMSICNVTQDGASPSIQFMNTTNCTRNMSWTVLKAVHHLHQFYFFAPDKVYTFSDSVQTSATTLETVSYDDFFHCHKPTTITPSSSPSPNATHEPNATSSTSWTAAPTHSSKTLFIIIGSCLGVAAIAAVLIAIRQCYIARNRPECDNKASAIPKNSGKVTDGRVLSGKGKQSQLKANQSKAMANVTSKDKSSVGGSKVKSVAKVPSVQSKADSKVNKPKSQA